jgi:hypothetical protein
MMPSEFDSLIVRSAKPSGTVIATLTNRHDAGRLASSLAAARVQPARSRFETDDQKAAGVGGNALLRHSPWPSTAPHSAAVATACGNRGFSLQKSAHRAPAAAGPIFPFHGADRPAKSRTSTISTHPISYFTSN